MAFAYLVQDTKSKKTRLIEASAPANAIAFCAKDAFTAQRVEGAVLDALKTQMTLEHVSPPKPEGGEAAGGTGDAKNGGEDKSGE